MNHIGMNGRTILVTGANGQLGNEMRIIAKGSNDKYIFTDDNIYQYFFVAFCKI